MATLVVDIPTIAGECQIAGYQSKVDAVGISDAISRPLVHFAGPGGSSPVRHSAICLKRYRDSASPLIAKACSTVGNLGEVKVYLFRTVETELLPYMVFTLSDAFITHVNYSTEDTHGIAFSPHLLDNLSDFVPQSWLEGIEGALGAGMQVPTRPAVRPAASASNMTYTNAETERVWFYGTSVTWTYTQYSNGYRAGDISKKWNIEQGVGV